MSTKATSIAALTVCGVLTAGMVRADFLNCVVTSRAEMLPPKPPRRIVSSVGCVTGPIAVFAPDGTVIVTVQDALLGFIARNGSLACRKEQVTDATTGAVLEEKNDCPF